MPPSITEPEQIARLVIRYGNFERTLNQVVKFLQDQCSSTLIIRGNAGSGKKTLLEEADNQLEGELEIINLNPYIDTDDFSALKYIASQLGIETNNPPSEILDEIKSTSASFTKTVVVVLHQFEEFCRGSQKLIYGLTTLTQHGHNFKVIGLTIMTDSTFNLEKRNRSRLNALFLELQLPYNNLKEYLEFTSLLLCKHKLNNIKDHLEFNYQIGNRSIRQLKRILISCCSKEKGRIVFNAPEDVQAHISFVDHLATRLKWLTRPELDLFRLAVLFCDRNETCDFNLKELENFSQLNHLGKYANTSNIDLTKVLAKLTLFVPSNPSKPVTPTTNFTCNCVLQELRHIIDTNKEFSSVRGDPLMKRMLS